MTSSRALLEELADLAAEIATQAGAHILAAGAETHHTHVAGLDIGVVTAPGVRDELLATLNQIRLP